MKRSFSIPAKLSELYVIREAILDFIGDALDETDIGRVILAVDEAVSNVIVHGYKYDESKSIDIDMNSGSESYTFTISDTAPQYNPLNSESPDIDCYHENGHNGGLGVDIYRRIMKVSYELNENGGNRLILIKEKKNENL